MALTLDRRKLQKKVQRMNEAAEEDRLRHASALQRRIRDVEVEIQSLTETIYRLRHARTSEEFLLAKDRRERLRFRLEALRHDADPISEVERINAAIDEAKAKHAEELQAEQRRLAAHLAATAVRLSNLPNGAPKHAAPWDINVTSPAPIYRRSAGLGEGDPSVLKVEWTRFDYRPAVPWLPASSSGSGATARGGAGDSPPRAGAAEPASPSGGERRQRPPSALAASASSLILQQHQQPLPPRLAATLTAGERARPLHPAYLLPSAAEHPGPFITLCGSGGGKRVAGPAVFSRPPRDRPATDAEARRAREYGAPDRAIYRPEREGKPRWQKPPPPAQGRTDPGACFSKLVSDSEWLRARDAAEEAERERRFYAMGEEGDEDAGGGASAGGDGLSGGGVSARV